MTVRKFWCALMAAGTLACSVASATQFIYLDFDSGNDASVNYTPTMRSQVVAGMQLIYGDFDIVVQDTLPASPFSRITFNEGGSGGLASQIDFRNLTANDSAIVNVTGLDLPSSAYVGASITIGAHEAGHLLGLRHGDSFGPIGTGLGSPGPGPGSYGPAYPGPRSGTEVSRNVMGTPALGISISTVSNQHWLSERSATKLAFAEQGTLLAETPGPKSTLATAQSVSYDSMIVPNTIVFGANAGIGDFAVDAFDVFGSLDSAGQVDVYSFDALAGDLLNVEVMSRAIDQRISNTVDTEISILDSGGSLINYWGSDAFNDDELETTDSILLDLTIPSDGTYYMQVNAFSASDTGQYELFAYRFNGATSSAMGDFDGNGDYACEDIDVLVAAIADGTNDTTYDLTADGLVNGSDLDAWLAEAGAAELASGNAYLPGDADLNGVVDGQDFITWNAHKFESIAAWCSGDFNADGSVDGGDFIIWNANKFQVADSKVVAGEKVEPSNAHLIFNSDVTAVPESTSGFVMLSCLLIGCAARRR